jgi:hypothetical protein
MSGQRSNQLLITAAKELCLSKPFVYASGNDRAAWLLQYFQWLGTQMKIRHSSFPNGQRYGCVLLVIMKPLRSKSSKCFISSKLYIFFIFLFCILMVIDRSSTSWTSNLIYSFAGFASLTCTALFRRPNHIKPSRVRQHCFKNLFHVAEGNSTNPN